MEAYDEYFNSILLSNLDSCITIFLDGKNGLFLYCNSTDGVCVQVNPEIKSFNIIDPNPALANLYKTSAPLDLSKLFSMLVKIIENSFSPSSPNSLINYHKLVDEFYSQNQKKINTEEIFGNNKHLRDKYVRSFLASKKMFHEISKTGLISADAEEFISFLLTAPIRDEVSVMFIKLMKSLYRPRDGKFSSKFARLLYKLKTVDVSKKDRIKYIKGVIDAIKAIGTKYKNFNQAMDCISSTYKI